MKKISPFIFLLALVKFVLPFTLHDPAFEVHRDEYLYYQQGQNLDFGYLENPPLIGLLSFISSLLGGGFFWIKFWPSFFGACTLLVTAAIVKELGGRLFAMVVASLGILFSAYLRIHFLFQPNFLDIFFWTLSAWFLLRWINTARPVFCFLMFIALSFSWYSKYSVLFFGVSLIASLLFTHHRKMLKEKHFWLAALMGTFLVLPNIFWQGMHNWPLLHHMKELNDTQLKYLSKTDFIKEQFLMLLPVCFVWIGGAIWLLRHNKFRIIGLMFFLVILLVMLGSGKGYYTLGAYPMMLAAGGVGLESITTVKIWLRYTVIAFILIVSVPFIPILLPIQSPLQMAAFNKKYEIGKLGLLKWEDRKDHRLQQDFADMLGWKEMTSKAETFFYALPIEKRNETMIYCRNYGQAGALKYYAKSSNFKQFVICDNGTFLFWIPEKISFHNLVYIGKEMPGKDDEVFNHFEKVTVLDSVANPLSREYRTKIIFFENGSDSAWMIAAKGLDAMKAEFGK